MNKQQVFYIHGAEAYSKYENFLQDLRTMPVRDLPGSEKPVRWSHSLREELGDSFDVFMPSMPNKQNAQYEEWKIWFERHFEYLKDDIVLVGWSNGGYFFVKYLIENNVPFSIKALILLAAPFENIEDEAGEDGGDFAFDTKRLGELEDKVKKVIVMHSKDDFVVPYGHALKYKEALPDAELITFEDKNHFLIEEFPELVGKIKEVSEQ